MTEEQDLARIERAARELVPALARRLAEHGFGEIEVRHDEVRVRVSAASPAESALPASGSRASAASAPGAVSAAASTAAPTAGPRRHPVASPAVGFFVYADGLGPGQEVQKGDALGWVEMLGVRHDVRAPRAATVRGLPAETGEAVEYGQPLVELEDRA